MIVKNTVSSCWLAPAEAIEECAVNAAQTVASTPIFFRADDIGVPGDKCRRMMKLFRTHHVPLHMAVTPAWLSESRWALLKEWAGNGEFIWHQHGWRHVNHQQSGKKGEFGVDRPLADKRADLIKGRDKLQTFMGSDFQPLFTPPWNRIDAETGQALADLGYAAVSRWQGENRKVPLPDALPDVPVNVDLHTRIEVDSAEGLAALTNQFQTAVESGRVGVMLHHQRMNDAAFDFLDVLFKQLSAQFVKISR